MTQNEAKKHLERLKKIISDYNAKMTETKLKIEIKREFNNLEKCRLEIEDSYNTFYMNFVEKIAIYAKYHDLNYYFNGYNNHYILVLID